MESSNDIISISKDFNLTKEQLINFLNQKKNTKPEYNTCSICLEKVVLPVQINGTPNDSKLEILGNRNKLCTIRACPSSKNNMICLLCWRNYLKSNRSKNNNSIKCLSNCCNIKTKGALNYGEIGRSANDLAMPDLWKKMDKCLDCGINSDPTYFRTCPNNCGFIGDTVIELGNHVRSGCTNKTITCILCKEKLLFKDLDKHKEEKCFYKCSSCNCPLKYNIEYVNNKPTIKIIEDHFCKNIQIFSCSICNNFFSLSSLPEHLKCMNFKNIHKFKMTSKSLGSHCTEKPQQKNNSILDNKSLNNIKNLNENDKKLLKDNCNDIIEYLQNFVKNIDIN